MKFFSIFLIGSIMCMFGGITIIDTSAEDLNMCSFKKSKTTCACNHKTFENNNFPLIKADCSRMTLEKFPKDNQLPGVEDIDLSHNRISILDSYTNSFRSLKIRFVKLSFNEINYISQDFFKYTPNLLRLDLSHNDLVKFPNSNSFRGLRNLTALNLSFNKLSTLPEEIFSTLPNLKELDLRYNYLGALLMDASNVFKTTMGLSREIVTLKLDGLGINNLHYEYFDEAHNLKHLSLSDNPLEEIPTVPYTLDFLDLSGTAISTISAKWLNYHSLKVLKLNRLKKLEKIEHYAFYNLEALEELHLSDTKRLTEFNNLAFGVILNDTNWSLKKITLARSGLIGLNSTFLPMFSKLEHIDLQSNPWFCNCDILWLQELNGSLFRDDNIRCLSPNSLLNKKIMELTETDTPGCTKTDNQVQKILISILGSLVAILVILIIYLVYLGPFANSNKYRGIGPESPYSGNTIGIIPARAEAFD